MHVLLNQRLKTNRIFKQNMWCKSKFFNMMSESQENDSPYISSSSHSATLIRLYELLNTLYSLHDIWRSSLVVHITYVHDAFQKSQLVININSLMIDTDVESTFLKLLAFMVCFKNLQCFQKLLESSSQGSSYKLWTTNWEYKGDTNGSEIINSTFQSIVFYSCSGRILMNIVVFFLL